MKNNDTNLILKPQEFEQFRDFLNIEIGLHLSPEKRSLVFHRLQYRVQHHGFKTFGEYLRYIQSNQNGAVDERNILFDKITTHTTRFFRESKQFDILRQSILPEVLANRSLAEGDNVLNLWSAGCSTGEEAYTLSMVLEEYKRDNKTTFPYKIFGNDISRNVVKTAQKGIYGRNVIRQIPRELSKRYMQLGSGPYEAYSRVLPILKKNIRFERQNLADKSFRPGQRFHIILCRNTMIYFDRRTREDLVNRFAKCLLPGGYLLVSFTESLNDLDAPFERISPSIYRVLI